MIRTRTFVPVLLVLAGAIMIVFVILTVVSGLTTVTGQVVSVEQASLTTISRLTLQDSSGKQWTFEGGGIFTGFTPSHLEEHRALQQPVTVEYEKGRAGNLRILGVSD